MSGPTRFRRILLKVSGEAFSGGGTRPVEPEGVGALAAEVAAARALGVQVAVVNGGGNILRGAQSAIAGLTRATADAMGMLATVVNALALQDLLEARGVATRVLTAIEMRAVAEPYIRRRAIRHLEKGRVVILAAGTGQPYFSTDTTAALRGTELGVDALLKGTQVDGVYDKDPKRHPEAVRFAHLSFAEVLARDLKVMDKTAFTLCEENRLPIIVFRMGGDHNLTRLLRGESVGTIVGAEALAERLARPPQEDDHGR